MSCCGLPIHEPHQLQKYDDDGFNIIKNKNLKCILEQLVLAFAALMASFATHIIRFDDRTLYSLEKL